MPTEFFTKKEMKDIMSIHGACFDAGIGGDCLLNDDMSCDENCIAIEDVDCTEIDGKIVSNIHLEDYLNERGKKRGPETYNSGQEKWEPVK